MPKLVTAALLAGPLTAGGQSWLAVKYTIAPGWHIYWENPGETGIATTIDLTLPEGFAAGEVQYPGPHAFMMPGDLVNYGYENEAILLTQLTAPAALPTAGEIKADTRWLVCREEQCVPGSAALSLSLAEVSADTPTADWAAKLPQSLPATATVSHDGLVTTITLVGPQSAEIFPDLALEGVLDSSTVTPGPGGLTVSMNLKEAAPAGAEAVLLVKEPAGEAHYRIGW